MASTLNTFVPYIVSLAYFGMENIVLLRNVITWSGCAENGQTTPAYLSVRFAMMICTQTDAGPFIVRIGA